MSDSWASRARLKVLDDSNLPAMQCRVYARIAVQDPNSKTRGYCLELAAGNSFDFGFCRRNNVPSLLRDVLTIGNTRVLMGNADFLMIPTVPTSHWVKQVRKYEPKKFIMWLENSIELNDEYQESILKLSSLGMRFAIRVDAMGDLASNAQILNCIDYLIVECERYEEFLPVIESLKKQNPKIETIAFKQETKILSFEKREVGTFKYVLGTIEIDNLEYQEQRPKWQHEMLRILAQLYSSIYDAKDISIIVQSYPYMATCMKGLLGSNHLTALTLKEENTNSQILANESASLSPLDIRNYLAISVAYNTFMLSEKAVCEQKGRAFNPENINYEPFVQAIAFAKFVDYMGNDVCDDQYAPQAFIAGLLRYSHIFLHDTYEKTFAEFPLDAVSSIYQSGGGQLGCIIRVAMDLLEHRLDEAQDDASNNGITISKENTYNYVSHSLVWADAALRAIGVIKNNEMYMR